ncbi:hypothetical protein ACFP9V_20295 [Deinococcus radiopugnans]|uniref:hypothetical protein n=1 Tax=Deinococcus radiopugnans TaxID=57497 RepID=UPI00361AE8D9
MSSGTAVMGNGATAKDGLYLTVDSTGKVVDFGIKGETSTSVGAEFNLGAVELGAGLEFEGPGSSVSFMPSVPGT